MPELPEVETVCRGLEGAIKGKTIARVQLRRKDLRIPFPPGFAKTLEGRTITNIARRSKYLLFQLSGGWICLAHLGMSGRFNVHEKLPTTFAAHDHVVVTFNDGTILIYNDARRFGLMTVVKQKELAQHALVKVLGVEPFHAAFSGAYLKQALAGRKQSIKVVLMDASLVVGVGNIYASEALFDAKIDPRTPANAVDKHASLVKSVRKVLEAAIASGGSSLRDFFAVGGEAGYFQHQFKVYGREGKPCYTCKSLIIRITQAGRSTFLCPKCQASKKVQNAP